LGVVVQWQPVNWFYAMFASLANNTPYGASPVQDISSDDWTNTFELGLIGEDVLGLGPGTLRVLPFFGTSKGETGAGIAINLEQKLSKSAPLGMFMRAGFTNDALGAVQGGKSSFAAGLVLNGPSESPLLKTQQAYLAGGFYWLEAPYPTTAHENEYGFELTYVMQLTETLTLQPDIQVILDPANNPTTDSVLMFTMQLTYTW
jgi:porin